MIYQYLAVITSCITAVSCVVLLILNWMWNRPSRDKFESQLRRDYLLEVLCEWAKRQNPVPWVALAFAVAALLVALYT